MFGISCILSTLGWVLTNPKYVNKEQEAGYTRGWMRGENASLVWRRAADFSLDTVVLRWGMPTAPQSCEGLGCGISWALHPNFCTRILSLFPERNGVISFVDCNTLRSAVVRALRTWEMNSQHIKFVDMTDECATHFAKGGDCAAAEVHVIASGMEDFGDDPEEFAAMVVHDYGNVDLSPVTTAGVQLDRGYGLRKSTLYININCCWYLDATFCYSFNRLREYTDAATAGFIIKMGAFGLMSVAVCFMLWASLKVVFAAIGFSGYMTKTDRRRKEVSNMGEKSTLPTRAISSAGAKLGEYSVTAILLTMVGITFGPVFYVQFFVPCWNCYDFEATIAHEVGHIIGFGHPDAQVDYNLHVVSDVDMNGTTCRSPLDHVVLSPPVKASTNRETSVMHSFTKHRDRTCLLQDDLDGLSFLYPSCANARKSPLCIKQTQFLGYIRLAIAAAVPFAASVVFVMILQWIAKWHHKRELKLMRAARRQSKVKQRWLRASLRASAQVRRRSSCDGGIGLPGAHTHSSGWTNQMHLRTKKGGVIAATSKNILQLVQEYGKATANRVSKAPRAQHRQSQDCGHHEHRCSDSESRHENRPSIPRCRPRAPNAAQRKPRAKPNQHKQHGYTNGCAACLKPQLQEESAIPRRRMSAETESFCGDRYNGYESPLHA